VIVLNHLYFIFVFTQLTSF